MEIIKHYKITNWCKYEEVESIPTMKFPPVMVPAYVSANGHIVTTEQWLNDDTGEGWEVRKFQVSA